MERSAPTASKLFSREMPVASTTAGGGLEGAEHFQEELRAGSPECGVDRAQRQHPVHQRLVSGLSHGAVVNDGILANPHRTAAIDEALPAGFPVLAESVGMLREQKFLRFPVADLLAEESPD